MERLKKLRKEKGVYQKDVAMYLGVDRTTYVKYETGDSQPNQDMLIALSEYFNVSTDYLLGRTDIPNGGNLGIHKSTPTITNDTTTFPVIGEIAAGYDSIVLENWTGTTVEIPNSYLKGRKKEDFIVLEVVGNSMFPEYREGDFVLILKQATLNYSGQVGAVLYNDEYTTLKKVEFAQGEDWLKLVPINPNCEIQTIKGEALEHCRIVGIPKFLIRDYDEK